MRTFVKACCLCLILLIISSAPRGGGGAAALPADRRFDEYGDLCWEDEKPRLDNFAIELQQEPEMVGQITVYAGRVSCEGEAKFRAERAKKWVVKRGIQADRVIVRDGGYLETATTTLDITPRDAEAARYKGLHPGGVTVFENCEGKIYLPAECEK